MRAILIAILYLVASAGAGCRAPETKTSQMPEELVGEWRNSDDPVNFGVICLLPDGRGMILGKDEATSIGLKFVATYNSKTHTLTATALLTEMEGGQKTVYFQYDPQSKTITCTLSDAPFSRVNLEVHPNLIKMLE